MTRKWHTAPPKTQRMRPSRLDALRSELAARGTRSLLVVRNDAIVYEMCWRSGISYHAGLGRYLWWQHRAEEDVDTRFQGGFGVYNAPEPWGPWTTAYFTLEWDCGPGETGSFPTHWMDPDGTKVHLVFSGNDYFSVRKAELIL